MKEFIIEVEKVTGYCSCGYQVGDTFICQEMNTPAQSFCGGAYMALFPMQVTLHAGAQFHFEKDPCSKTGIACPDRGYVIFKICKKDN